MKRIMILGSGGAGKSTFARRLGEITGIKVYHLDKLYWQSGWIEPPKEQWLETLKDRLAEDSWITDGNFGSTIEMRLEKCDTAILLDLPRTVCLYRVFKRFLTYRGQTRPDMGEGCHEKIDLEFLSWIWSFPKKDKLRVEGKLQRFENEKTIIRLRSKREVENFLANLEAKKV